MDGKLTLATDAELRGVYREPSRRSLEKEIDHLDAHCRDFIAHSPFAVLATADGAGRVDVSPKGGPPGFVCVLEESALAIPDMAGNNRLDSMSNIVQSDGVAILFMVPGVDETLRVVGRARVTVDPVVLARCDISGLAANVAIVVEVTTAFIHCAKAMRRSALWQPERWPSVEEMATPACMLRDHIGLAASGDEVRQVLEEGYAATTWVMAGRDSPTVLPQSEDAEGS